MKRKDIDIKVPFVVLFLMVIGIFVISGFMFFGSGPELDLEHNSTVDAYDSVYGVNCSLPEVESFEKYQFCVGDKK